MWHLRKMLVKIFVLIYFVSFDLHTIIICFYFWQQPAFKHKGNLTTHKKLHGPNCPECEYCGKRFARKDNLAQHILIHTKEKPYKCEYCHKKYRQSHSLKEHLRNHTGEKPFKCDVCSKSFTNKQAMIIHRRCHS